MKHIHQTGRGDLVIASIVSLAATVVIIAVVTLAAT